MFWISNQSTPCENSQSQTWLQWFKANNRQILVIASQSILINAALKHFCGGSSSWTLVHALVSGCDCWHGSLVTEIASLKYKYSRIENIISLFSFISMFSNPLLSVPESLVQICEKKKIAFHFVFININEIISSSFININILLSRSTITKNFIAVSRNFSLSVIGPTIATSSTLLHCKRIQCAQKQSHGELLRFFLTFNNLLSQRCHPQTDRLININADWLFFH